MIRTTGSSATIVGMKFGRRFGRRAWTRLLILDGTAALLLVLAWLVGGHSMAATIALVVVAGILILLGWTLTLATKTTDRSGRGTSDSSRPGVKVIDH